MVAAIQNLGNAYFAQERYDEAIEQYKAAIDIDFDNAQLYYNLGVAYSKKELYNDGESALLNAVEIEPDNGPAHKVLAICYYYLKEYELALEHAELARGLGEEVQQDFVDTLNRKVR